MSKTDEYELWLSHLDRPYVFSTPFDGQDFVLLLVIADPKTTDDDRNAICAEIIRQGCRYAVCAGVECSRWETCIDMAYMESDPNFSPPKERFVMTTSHEDEPLEDVVEFFRLCTAFDSFIPRRYLALVLGGNSEIAEKVFSSLKKCFELAT